MSYYISVKSSTLDFFSQSFIGPRAFTPFVVLNDSPPEAWRFGQADITRGSSNSGPVPVQPAPPPPPPPPNYQVNIDKSSDPRFQEPGKLRPVLSFIGLLLTAFLIAFMLNAFVIQSYQVDGQSMEPTLQNDDRLIVDKVPRTLSRITGRSYLPKRGTIIIFNEDNLPGFVGPKQLIKRVIALPGEHVVVKGTKVTVYNAAHPEGFDPDLAGGYTHNIGESCGDADKVIGPNQIFVMGDNRGNSEDSRCFGPIQADQVVAKLVLRILPLNKSKTF